MNSNVSAWTFGGSILSFAFPMLLFIVVGGALYVLYTKPEFVPGHRAPGLERPVSYTAVPGKPLGPDARAQASVEAARARPAAAGTAGIVMGATADPGRRPRPRRPRPRRLPRTRRLGPRTRSDLCRSAS